MFNVNLKVIGMGDQRKLNPFGMAGQRERREKEAASNGASSIDAAAAAPKPQRRWRDVVAELSTGNREGLTFSAEKSVGLRNVGEVNADGPARLDDAPTVQAISTETVRAHAGGSDNVTDLADELSEAQRGAIEQRKAAEALLREACMLEERLARDAAAAHLARARLVADEKAALADQAAANERKAAEAAGLLADRLAIAQKQNIEAEEQLADSRVAVHAAMAAVAEQKQRLDKAQKVAEEVGTQLQVQERRAAERLVSYDALQREISRAATQTAKCQAAREAAREEARIAEERLMGMGGSVTTTASSAGIEELERLRARVAERSAAVHV